MNLPIFPLNGAVLFPGTSLPLNIFEERYIEMVNYALANNRMIGMIQTKEDERFHKIGCVGKISSFSETVDGRYLISLQGNNRFQINKEIETNTLFRMVDAKIIENEDENEDVFNEQKKIDLLRKYKKYIVVKNLNLDLNEIEKVEFNQIIKFLAMISPFKNIEKQALLETDNINDFYNKLSSIIELETLGSFENKTIN